MPSWNIHLEVGERLADVMKLTGEKREQFLLGCILPDINNGFCNKVKVSKEHGETHWAFDKKSTLNFYEKYKEQIERREPIYFGYLFHLYADGFFNYNYYHALKDTKYGRKKINKRCDIKHNDFWVFDKKFMGRELNVKDKAAALEIANQIENIDVSEAELNEVEEIIRSNILVNLALGRQYIFWKEKEFEQIMDDLISHFCKKYLKESNA